MTFSRKATGIVMLLAIVVLGGYDLVVALNQYKGDTFSEIIRDGAYHFAGIPWVVGLLAGHWFWNGKRYKQWWVRISTIGAFLLMLLLQWFGISHPMASLTLGVVSGRLLWSLEPTDD